MEPNPPVSPEHSPERSPEPVRFPVDPAEFADDVRISWSKLDNNWILETKDEEFTYNASLKAWNPVVDPEVIEQYQANYGGPSDDGETEVPHPRELKKRKRAELAAAPKAKKPRVNTAVWVSKLPLDAQKEEIRKLFAKYGIIAEEIDSGDAKIKMYKDEDGKFKGEALVVYFRPESVGLAIQMLDETEFRFGVTSPSGLMRVEVADDTNHNAKKLDRMVKHTAEQRRKIAERTKKLNSKLADWSDDEPLPPPKPTKKSKIVVLKHMFTLQGLEAEPADILNIKEEIRNECSKIGEVTNVILYDKEPEGVVTVRFKEVEAARLCVKKLNGRFFDGKHVEASILQGRGKFKKSKVWREDSQEDSREDTHEDTEYQSEEEDRLD